MRTEKSTRAAYRKAYNILKVMGVPVFVNDDHAEQGNFGINAEAPGAEQWVNYHGNPPGWFFGVSPIVEEVLDQYGLFAEWVNPGCLGVYEK